MPMDAHPTRRDQAPAEASEICWRTGTNCPRAREVSTSPRRDMAGQIVDGEATGPGYGLKSFTTLRPWMVEY